MRTVLFLASGFLLLTAVFILGKLFSENFASATAWATFAFLMLWLIITGANMWIGVTKAGYSASDELPTLASLWGSRRRRPSPQVEGSLSGATRLPANAHLISIRTLNPIGGRPVLPPPDTEAAYGH